MSAYLVAICRSVSERRKLEDYWANVGPSFEGAGGKPLVAYTPFTRLEGTGPVEGMVVIEFPSTEAALSWYESPAYQAAKKLREGGADFDLVLAEGGFARAADRMPHIK